MPLLRFLPRRSIVVISVLYLLACTAAIRAQNFLTAPTTAVGSTSATQTATVKITTAGQAASIAVMAPGSTSQDYQLVTGGTCAVLTVYTVGQTCTVKFTFKPTVPWTRYGAVAVYDGGNNVLGNIYLVGVGTGPQVSYPLSSASVPVTSGSGFGTLENIAVDALGNVYLSDYSNNAVKVIAASNGSVSTLKTLQSPTGVAMDGAGNLYVSDNSAGVVVEFVAINGSLSSLSNVRTVVSGLNAPLGLAVDGSGNLYVADLGNRAVKQVVAVNGVIPASPSVVSLAPGNFSSPAGLAVDPSGNVYVADESSASVKKILATGGTVSGTSSVNLLGGGFNSPTGVAVDMLGNVYVADYIGHAVSELLAVSGAVPTGPVTSVSLYGVSTSQPLALAVDGHDNLYISDEKTNQVNELSTQTLPSLSFASTAVTATSSDSPQTVTVQNIGNTTLTFPAPSAIGALNPSTTASFVYSGSSTCTQIGSSSSAFTLASAASCTELVSFVPATSGPIMGSLVDTDNNLNVAATKQTIPLSGTGTGTAATITVSPVSISYGTATTTLTAMLAYAGSTTQPSGTFTFVVDSGTTVTAACTGTSSPLTCTASYATALLSVGAHTITASLAADANYKASSNTATLTVTAVTPTVTVSAVSAAYGTASTTLTAKLVFSGSGALPSGAFTFKVDAAGVVVTGSCAGTASPLTCTASYTTTTLAVGAHTITASQAADGNYNAASNTGTLTVTAVTPRVQVSAVSIAYGTATAGLTANVTYTGSGAAPTGAVTFKVDTTGVTVTGACTGTSSPLVCTATYNTATLAAGAHTITFAIAADANYTTASGTGTLTVTPIAPTITFTVPNHTYGDAPFTVSATSNSGGAFTYTVVSGPATINGSTVTLTGAGPVVLQAAEAASGNYTSGTQQASFTVAMAQPTITFTVPNHTYGDAPFTVSATSNSTGAFTYTVASGPATVAGTTVTITGGGMVCLLASEAADANYLAGSQQACFTVAQEAQTINASSLVTPVTFGTPPITLTSVASSGLPVTYTYVSGPGSVSGGVLTLTGAGTIVFSANQAGNMNYLAAPPVTEQVVVMKASPVVTWAQPAAISYGTPLSATQLDAVVTGVGGGVLAGTKVYTPAAGAILGVGAQTLSVTFTPVDQADYTTAVGIVTLLVGQGTPTVTLTTSGTPVLAQTAVTFTAAVTAAGTAAPTGVVNFVDGATLIGSGTIVNGVATFTTASLPAGTNSITAVYTGDANYGAVTSASVVETVLDFSLTVTSTSQTVALSGTATYPLTVTPLGGATLAGTVNFTVTGVPAGATATFTPATVAAGAGTTNVALTIVAPAQFSSLEKRTPPGKGTGFAPVLLALLLLPFSRRLRKRVGKLPRVFLMGLLLLAGAGMAMGLSGCSTGAPTGETKTYTLTVNATSGTLVHSTTVTLTVN